MLLFFLISGSQGQDYSSGLFKSTQWVKESVSKFACWVLLRLVLFSMCTMLLFRKLYLLIIHTLGWILAPHFPKKSVSVVLELNYPGLNSYQRSVLVHKKWNHRCLRMRLTLHNFFLFILVCYFVPQGSGHKAASSAEFQVP